MFVGLFVVGTCAVPVKEWLFFLIRKIKKYLSQG
jgi:hypothetical protein